ncbi:MAG TPA: DUF5666 domain-containing protein [Pseudonocardiaceae bacterium]|nr:DUF5666 domain-containing protein [Pseudonocardiaceae bacterium]
MSAQPSIPATDAGRNRRIRSLPGVLVVTGVVALVVAACGSGGGTPTAAPSAAQPTRQAVVPQTPPGAFGTAAAVSATSIEVQSRQNGQVTVKFNGDTKFTDTVAATSKDVKVGECVTVTASSGGARPAKLTARTVAITPATSTGCTLGPFRGAAGRGGGDFPGRSSSRARPPGTSRNGNNFGRAFGSVTAVNATGFTVQNAARGKNPAFTTTVMVNASTTYTRTVAATSSALAVGVCVAAVGPSDDTGAVTATAISVSKPGDNGCAGVFGGGGFRGNGNGGGEGGGPAPSQIPGGGNG